MPTKEELDMLNFILANIFDDMELEIIERPDTSVGTGTVAFAYYRFSITDQNLFSCEYGSLGVDFQTGETWQEFIDCLGLFDNFEAAEKYLVNDFPASV